MPATLPFLIGTQYYRYPTPGPDCWEADIRLMKKMGLDFFQVRPQWRVHERKEGRYEWDDIDRLFELSRKHNIGIVFKFFLETAPEWLFDRYGAFRTGPDGKKLLPWSEGSFHVGGFAPCFDPPIVQRKAASFITHAVKRYRSADDLLFWSAWNEPRNRPYAECACTHSLSLYRDFLRDRFETIEDYNCKLGMSEHSFSGIKAPLHSPLNFSTAALWKEWGRSRVVERIRMVTQTIKAVDKERKVVTHSGMCSPLQDILNDGSDDFLNAKEVDAYGSSYVFWTGEFQSFARIDRIATTLRKDFKRDQFIFSLQNDWHRAVTAHPMTYEFYSNSWDKETPDFTAQDIRLRLNAAVNGGTRLINLWQFREETLDNESGCAGILGPDNKETDRSREIELFAKKIKAKAKSRKPRAPIAVVYDVESDMASRLESTDDSNRFGATTYRYKNSIKGWHSMLWQAGIDRDFLDSREWINIKAYKVIVLPYMTRITQEQSVILQTYVKNGGIVLADPGLGMRDNVNRLNPAPYPCHGLSALFGVSHGHLKNSRLPGKFKVNRVGKGRAVYFKEFPGERHFLEAKYNVKPILALLRKSAGIHAS